MMPDPLPPEVLVRIAQSIKQPFLPHLPLIGHDEEDNHTIEHSVKVETSTLQAVIRTSKVCRYSLYIDSSSYTMV